MTAPEARCLLRLDYKAGTECGQPALYRVYGVDCYVCCEVGIFDRCHGHPVCADHAAKLRAESVAQVSSRSKATPPGFTVDRIHSIAVMAGAS